jgi:hypothetical protein
MGTLAWSIVCGLAGWLASLVVRGKGLGLLSDISSPVILLLIVKAFTSRRATTY